MERFEFGRWSLLIDVWRTRRAYAAIWEGCAEQCRCVECQNYIKLRHRAFNGEALALFWQLGTSPQRDLTLDPVGPDPATDRFVYRGAFLVVGQFGAVAAQPLPARERPGWNPDLHWLNDSLALGIASANHDGVPPSFAGEPLVAVVFEAHLPWAIDVPLAGYGERRVMSSGREHRRPCWDANRQATEP